MPNINFERIRKLSNLQKMLYVFIKPTKEESEAVDRYATDEHIAQMWHWYHQRHTYGFEHAQRQVRDLVEAITAYAELKKNEAQ